MSGHRFFKKLKYLFPCFSGMRLTACLTLVATVLWTINAATFNVALASSATFNQNDWSGGISVNSAEAPGNVTGWTNFLENNNVNTANGLSLLPQSFSVSESFDTTANKDVAQTTANWNTAIGQVEVPSPVAADLTSSIASLFLTQSGAYYTVFSMASDATGRTVYLGGDNGRLLKYDTVSGVVTNLASLLPVGLSGYRINTMVYDSANQALYFGAQGNKFGRYNVSTGTITNLSSALPSSWVNNSLASLVYDAPDNVVYIGGTSRLFTKYDVATGVASDLTSLLTSTWTSSNDAIFALTYDSANGDIYLGGGWNLTDTRFSRYHIADGQVTNLLPAVASIFTLYGPNNVASLAYDSVHSLIYLGGYRKFAVYNPATGLATDLFNAQPLANWWGNNTVNALNYDAASNLVYLGGANGRLAKYNSNSSVATNLNPAISGFWGTNAIYASALTSNNGMIFFGGKNGKFAKYGSSCRNCVAVSTSLDTTTQNIFSATLTANDLQGTGTINYELSNDGGVTWNAVVPGVAYNFASAGSDLRFKIVVTGNATVQDVTINYQTYPASGSLTSSAYDTTQANNVMQALTWVEDAVLPAGTTATVSLRTASAEADLNSAAWVDFNNSTINCSKNGSMVTCPAAALPAAWQDRQGDQWWQYKVTLISDGAATPRVSEVGVQYWVNAAPEFDATFGQQGVAADQVTDNTDPDWGMVKIQYAVRDTDTISGLVTPSFDYNTGAGWQPIPAGYLGLTDLADQAVQADNYTVHTAVWDVNAQFEEMFLPNVQVRVTVNDQEASNNSASVTSGVFTVDAKTPTVNISTLDDSAGQVNLNLTDYSNLAYRLSNNSDFSFDGQNPLSGLWQGGDSPIVDTAVSWIPPSGSSYKTVYLQVMDVFGHRVTLSMTAPYTPRDIKVIDISNPGKERYRSRISWDAYNSEPSAMFASYELYRSTDNENFDLIAAITDVNTKSYRDENLVGGTRYYYKLRIVDTDGDISAFSPVISITPGSHGH